MKDYERIIAGVHVSMAMEDMALTEELKQKMKDCLLGKIAYIEAVNQAIEKYQQPSGDTHENLQKP